ncbi:hypothetical protein [Rubinisphaera italica]|uniref:Uncharacterized protein n=1 Tax=Rubinisphaera italica TaxID=2527969 RepID=A0A5C5XKD8_9PLAN|nr:hypothetical protein [Rubinisphaera italica]TWT63168.1 hypothetical protein Pan54_39210 [Rubinisphaera italica]
MKRILAGLFVAIATVYLGLWIYQIGFSDGVNEGMKALELNNHQH